MSVLGVVEIWVRKSLDEVITYRNANDAFAPVMAVPNRNTNPDVGSEHSQFAAIKFQ